MRSFLSTLMAVCGKNGVAVYTLTSAGPMLEADLSGAKYRKSRKLNPST